MSMELRGVSHIYDKDGDRPVCALDNINLSVDENEFIGLIGHTGCGKSTLIQHMNGLLKPTEGEIFYNGVNIYSKGYSMKELRQKVGLVFQYPEHQLFEETVFKDVCFGPLNKGLPQKEAELKAFTALETVGLPHEYYYASPFDLSGGQKRLAAIAGVIAMEPEVLILDEPTAGLDPYGREKILHQIKLLRDRYKINVILVSHSMEDVANYVDRIIAMDSGKIVYDDIPKNVFAHVDTLEKMGLAVPTVTYFMKALKEKGFDVNESAITIDEAVEEIMKLKAGR